MFAFDHRNAKLCPLNKTLMSVSENLRTIWNELPPHVALIAVSKTHGPDKVLEAYRTGQKAFGENKVQEMVGKAEQLPKDIEWHLIGHLQTNKVKYIAPFVHTVHSIDSAKLLKEIDKRAGQNGRSIECLLQVHIAEEETKFGLSGEEAEELLRAVVSGDFPNVVVKGLMGMATFTENEAQVRKEFGHLKQLFEKLKATYSPTSHWQPETLSMGMSGDYAIAIEEGSTMVRIGSAIFGAR